MVRDGYVAVDRQATTLDLGPRHVAAFDACRLSRETIRDELIDYVDRLLKRRGKLLEQLAVPPVEDPADAESVARRAAAETALRELARTDDTTARLYALDASWNDAANRIAAWMDVHLQTRPADAR